MSKTKQQIKEFISKFDQKHIDTIRSSDPPERALNFHHTLNTTLIELDNIKFKVEDSEFISDVLFLLKYNLTPYINKKTPIVLSISIDYNFNFIEHKTLIISLTSNEKSFDVKINILKYNNKEFINTLSESLFPIIIYKYTNIEDYLNKLSLINNIKELFNLSEEDTHLIHNCLNKDYKNTITKNLIFCHDYSDSSGFFYIIDFNKDHKFKIKFNKRQVTISFLNFDVSRDYILLSNSNISVKGLQDDIYETLNFSEFGYSSFSNVLELLKIKSIVNY